MAYTYNFDPFPCYVIYLILAHDYLSSHLRAPSSAEVVSYMNDLQWLRGQRAQFQDLAIPRHVAIIMDGNGRYARRFMRPRSWGHRRGAVAFKQTVQAAHLLEIPYLTLYTFSLENWGRSEEEVQTLMDLLMEYLYKERDELNSRNIRLHTIGDLSLLPAEVSKCVHETCEMLSGNTDMQITLALSYSGREELTSAMRALAETVASGELSPSAITSKDIEGALGTSGMPDPDLMIRTSGEIRLSNFLLWQLAYTEFYFTEVCWPEFTPRTLWRAILSYNQRQRSYGLISNVHNGKLHATHKDTSLPTPTYHHRSAGPSL